MEELRPLRPDSPRLVPEAVLPRYRFVPDLHPHPRRDPEGSLYGAPEYARGLPADRWREDDSFLLGVDLYHQGYLWESHEAWEACFFAAEAPAHRALLQALIQLAAALLQRHRGIGNGVRRLARAVDTRLGIACDAVPGGGRLAGLDPHALRADVRRHFAGALNEEGDPLDVSGPPPRLSVE